MRNERWNSPAQIKSAFPEYGATDKAGPVLYSENGKRYIDDSEAHIAVVGRTGKGKSQCGSLPFIHTVIEKGESFVAVDPKGEGFKMTSGYIPEDYQLYCIDFRCPRRSPTRWNPLSAPFSMLGSNDPDERDIGCSMISELWSAVFPYDDKGEKFWVEAARNLAKGLTYSLFETVTDERLLNINTVMLMLEQAETRMALKTAISSLYELLDKDSLARRNLATYVSAPNETRGSIHSVASAGAEIFSRSKGLMEMLSDDTLNIAELDVDRPFAIYVVIPDEESTYDTLAGVLTSQIIQHLLRIAAERGGRLPIRTNVILEELGSVGKATPDLVGWMTAGRSRAVRLMLVLQSSTQLETVYGKAAAETINSCIGITMGFSTNNWETLNEWSHRCGERTVQENGQITRQPLISAAQLAAMPTGTVLIMVDGRYKFIAHLPFFGDITEGKVCSSKRIRPETPTAEVASFSLEEHVAELKRRREAENERKFERNIGNIYNRTYFLEHNDDDEYDTTIADDTEEDDDSWDFDVEDDEDEDNDFDHDNADEPEIEDDEDEDDDNVCSVYIISPSDKETKHRLAQIVAKETGESLEKATKRFDSFVASFPFKSNLKAQAFADRISEAGGQAVVI